MARGIKRLQKLRERRKKAVALFEQGERQATVAQILRVSKQSANQWYWAWQNKDLQRLNGAARAGRKSRLDADQLIRVEKELLRGAAAHGFTTDLWTLPRVATLIERLTGVSYHSGHVWKLLKAMGWSLQRPSARAKERDDTAVKQWNTQTWAKVKKTPKTSARG
jgi:transposase